MTKEDQINEALAYADCMAAPDDVLTVAALYLSDNFDVDPDEAYFLVREL